MSCLANLFDSDRPVLPAGLQGCQPDEDGLQSVVAGDRWGLVIANGVDKCLYFLDVGILVSFQKEIERFFARRPKLKQAHMTSDMTIFLKEENAKSYAAGLKNKKVEHIKRA